MMEHVRDIIPRVLERLVVPQRGGRMQWTDEVLSKRYANALRLAGTRFDEEYAELYRLARLGLAAEQVGRDSFGEALPKDITLGAWGGLCQFLNHEAWHK